jgi:hypothetical protein
MNTKKCFKCGAVKPIDEFNRHPEMGDGHLNKCKSCVGKYLKRYYKKKRKDSTWLAKERDRCRIKAKGYGTKYLSKDRSKYVNRFKKQATTAVAHAIERGRMEKPDRCSRCGKKDRPRKIHAHHDDYKKRLIVEWLCSECHGKVHRKSLS